LSILGHVRAELHHRLPEALSLHERALMLNPNLALGWSLSSAAYAYLGDLTEADRRAQRYKRLAEVGPLAFCLDTIVVLIALLKREHEAAVVAGRNISEMHPGYSAACKPYLAALGHLGRRQDADVVRRRLLSIEPQFTIRRFLAQTPLALAADRDHFAEGLRLAGLPA
jgi:tetratricopeptide (TPR) repeat protein